MREYLVLYRLWNLEKFPAFPPYLSSETKKNFDLFPYIGFGHLYRLGDLKKFRAILPCICSGTWKNSELPPYIGPFPLYLNSG